MAIYSDVTCVGDRIDVPGITVYAFPFPLQYPYPEYLTQNWSLRAMAGRKLLGGRDYPQRVPTHPITAPHTTDSNLAGDIFKVWPFTAMSRVWGIAVEYLG